MRFPPIPHELISALQAQFPEKSPSPKEDFGALMVRAGEANVMRFLKAQHDRQQENVLSPGSEPDDVSP